MTVWVPFPAPEASPVCPSAVEPHRSVAIAMCRVILSYWKHESLEPVLLLTFIELVRFLQMHSSAGRVSLLKIEFRQPPMNDGTARIEIERTSILVDRPSVHFLVRVGR